MTTKPKLERFLKIPYGVTHGAASLWPRESLKGAFLWGEVKKVENQMLKEKVLLKNLGMIYELTQIGNAQVELKCKEFPEICQTYNLDFILNLVSQGVFIEVNQATQ